MKYLLILLSIISTSSFSCEFKRNFDDEQWFNIRNAFYRGMGDDLSWSLSAIIIIESSAGKRLINEATHDYGIMQINIKTAKVRLARWAKSGRDFGKYDITNDNDVKQLLVSDSLISTTLALEELNFWKSKRNGDWNKVYASYNGGYYINKKHQPIAEKYSKKVISTIKKLKLCKMELLYGEL